MRHYNFNKSDFLHTHTPTVHHNLKLCQFTSYFSIYTRKEDLKKQKNFMSQIFKGRKNIFFFKTTLTQLKITQFISRFVGKKSNFSLISPIELFSPLRKFFFSKKN